MLQISCKNGYLEVQALANLDTNHINEFLLCLKSKHVSSLCETTTHQIIRSIIIGLQTIVLKGRVAIHHNITQIHVNVMWDWQYYAKQSSHSNWMWRIFCTILLVPHNTVVDSNDVCMSLVHCNDEITLYYVNLKLFYFYKFRYKKWHQIPNMFWWSLLETNWP